MTKYLVLILLSCFTVAGSGLISWYLYHIETEQISYQFDRKVSRIVHNLEQELVKRRAILRHWKIFYESQKDMNAQIFSSVAEDALSAYSSIQMVAWSPRVAGADKAAFEQQQRKRWSQFRIFDINASLVKAAASGDEALMRKALKDIAASEDIYRNSPKRDYYYPFTLIEPVKNKGYLLGADLLSVDQSALDMQVELSSQVNDVVALPAFPSPFTPNNEMIFLAIVPVFDKDTFYGAELRGYVTAALEVNSLLANTLENNEQDINFALIDETENKEYDVLFQQGVIDVGHAYYEKRQILPVFGRYWSIIASPGEAFTQQYRSPLPWIAAVVGTLLSVAVILYMLFLQRRNQLVRQLVEKRTRELREANKELGEVNSKLEEMARTDGLTQLANRRFFNEVLDSEWRKASRTGKSLGVLLMDVDFFKKYNDHYGHVAGDECLQAVAAALAACFSRAGDLVARYGGEEFAVILPNTGKEAIEAAERARAAIAELNLPHEKSSVADHVSVSIGACSVVPSETMKQGAFLESADQGLYQAKEQGRNSVAYQEYSESIEEDLAQEHDLNLELGDL